MLTGQPEKTDDAIIANDDFFPDVALIDFLLLYSVANNYESAALIYAVEQAIVKINLRLQAFKTLQQTAGYNTLNEYIIAHPNSIGNGDLLDHFYKKAVFCTAKAWVLIDANGGVQKHTDDNMSLLDLNATVQKWLNEADDAVYTFLAKFDLQNEPSLTGAKKLHIKLL